MSETIPSASIPAPGSPREKVALEEIRLALIAVTRLAESVGWHWELNARPLNGKRRMSVVVIEQEARP